MAIWQPSQQLERWPDERRRAPRHDANLSARVLFNLSLTKEETGVEESHVPSAPLMLAGHTRNISETGLALIVPDTRFGARYPDIVVGRRVRVMLGLPSGPVWMQALVVRCERLSKEDEEKGYLIGARIAEMSDQNWVKLVQFVRRLR